jgi:hypothetical protein
LYPPLLWPRFDCFGGVEAGPQRRIKKHKISFPFLSKRVRELGQTFGRVYDRKTLPVCQKAFMGVFLY